PASFAGPPATTDEIVFAVGGDGTLHALNLAAKSTVFSVSLGTPPLSGAVLSFVPDVTSPTIASVRFLLDGEAFFPTMRDLMIATARQSFTPPPAMPGLHEVPRSDQGSERSRHRHLHHDVGHVAHHDHYRARQELAV